MNFRKWLVLFIFVLLFSVSLLAVNKEGEVANSFGGDEITAGESAGKEEKAATTGQEVKDDDESKGEKGDKGEGNFTLPGSLDIRAGQKIYSKPWGDVVGTLNLNDTMRVIGKEGNWWKIDKPMAGYVREGEMSEGGNGGNNGGGNGGNEVVVGNEQNANRTEYQKRAAQVCADYVKKYSQSGSFPYAAGTENGNLGCANVVSKALIEAGENISVILGCSSLRSELLKKGWEIVPNTNIQPGDVIFWKENPKHEHVGIAIGNPPCTKAMNNSSGKRAPVNGDIYIPRGVKFVLRKKQ